VDGIRAFLLGVLALGCGAAPEDGEELGEASEPLLGVYAITLQQGKPAVLCGPTSASPCVTLSDAYQGTSDATVLSLSPFKNTGNQTTLTTYTRDLAFDDIQIPLLRWDTAGIKPLLVAGQMTVTQAVIELKVTDPSASDLRVVKMPSPWSEGSVTWANWGWMSAEMAPTYATFTPSANGVISIPLTSLTAREAVRSWITTPEKNYGVWIGRPLVEITDRLGFDASEKTGVGAAPPKLKISLRVD
jgi:hypothetical protein